MDVKVRKETTTCDSGHALLFPSRLLNIAELSESLILLRLLLTSFNYLIQLSITYALAR